MLLLQRAKKETEFDFIGLFYAFMDKVEEFNSGKKADFDEFNSKINTYRRLGFKYDIPAYTYGTDEITQEFLEFQKKKVSEGQLEYVLIQVTEPSINE